MSTYEGPTEIDCQLRCDVPEGYRITEMPPTDKNFGDILRCPHEGCGRTLLVQPKEATEGGQ